MIVAKNLLLRHLRVYVDQTTSFQDSWYEKLFQILSTVNIGAQIKYASTLAFNLDL